MSPSHPLRKFQPSRDTVLIGYKLLADLLFLGLAFFVLAFIADEIIPGIVSEKISFTRIIFFLAIDILALELISNRLNIEIKKNKTNRYILVVISLVLALLVFNSLLKLNIFLNLFILSLLAATGYFIYRVMMDGG
jgi:hypothetical protein